jgi:hypothetical protein
MCDEEGAKKTFAPKEMRFITPLVRRIKHWNSFTLKKNRRDKRSDGKTQGERIEFCVCVREKEETDDDDVCNERVHCTCAIATAIGGRLYEDTDPSD